MAQAAGGWLPLNRGLCYRRQPRRDHERAAGCGSMGRAEVAQLVEHRPEEAGVVSSILTLGTITRGVPVNGRKWLSW